ncbi:MAG: hypothetical protein ACRDMX_01880 [Solirubrobacteraceae bacterium]
MVALGVVGVAVLAGVFTHHGGYWSPRTFISGSDWHPRGSSC